MKIVYLLKSFANKAGTERVISDKINYLAEKGYDITLVTYEQGNHPEAFFLHPSVRHLDLNTRFFTVLQAPVYKRPSLLYQLRKQFCVRLQKMLDEIMPDIMICTTYSYNLLDVILTIRTRAYKIVESHVACFSIKKSFEYRHLPIVRKLMTLYDSYMMSRLNKCDKLIVLTEGDAIEWRKHLSHVEVIPNPVTFYPLQVLPHDGTGRRIISVGRLHEQKGFDLLIQAFALISDKCPEWCLHIYGSGNDEKKLNELIEKYQLETRIRILAPTSSIYEEYQRSEFLVVSSRYEGFGLVLLEAMSCGIPCVSFRCKYGPEDILSDGEDGLLVTDGQVNELAEKMLWMMMHTDERLLMGEKARETVKNYQIESIMMRWVSLFESLQK